MENQKEMEKNQENEYIKRNQFQLSLNGSIYKLILEIDSKNFISFKLRQIGAISHTYYSLKYNYEEIINQLNLEKNDYKNIAAIFDLFDTSIRNKNLFYS